VAAASSRGHDFVEEPLRSSLLASWGSGRWAVGVAEKAWLGRGTKSGEDEEEMECQRNCGNCVFLALRDIP